MKTKYLKLSRSLTLAISIAIICAFVIGSIAFFADRESGRATFSVASFKKDGYSISRTVEKGPYAAGDDISIAVKENNGKDESIQSVVTMTAKWTSPDTSCSPFGNSNVSDNVVIKVDGVTIPEKTADSTENYYTYDAETGVLTFVLPTHKMEASSTGNERVVTFHIPESLKSTGTFDFEFAGIELAQTTSMGGTGFTAEYTHDELKDMDFSADVVWDFSAAGDKSVIGTLSGTAGDYSLNVTGKGTMKDWASNTASAQSNYKDSITSITIGDKITNIGDHAFDGFSEIQSIVIPEDVTELGAMSFGNCGKLTEITFEGSDNIQFPNAGTGSGAFYVPSYLKTTFNFNGNNSAKGYNWVADNRMKVGITSATLNYEDVVVGQTEKADLDILPTDADEAQSIKYEIIAGNQYADINPNTGDLTGVAQGEVTVKVTIIDANGDKVTAQDTVNILGVGIADAELSYPDVTVGQKVDAQLDINPDDFDEYQSIKYEVISGGAYASVDEKTGEVTGLAKGEATIKVTIIDTNGNEITDEATVKVLAVSITDAVLEYDDVTVGQTVQPQLDINPDNHGGYESIKYEITKGDEYADIDPDTGALTGVAKGEVTVKVTITDANGDKVTAEAPVKVLAVSVSDAILKYDDVVVGQTVPSQLTINPSNHGTPQSVTYKVVSGGEYASVNASSGVVTGLKQGEATIEVTIIDANGDKVTAQGTVNVLGIGITSATLTYDEVKVGETVDPNLDIDPDDYDDAQSITYEIVDGDEFIDIDPATGKVTGKAEGEATVKVTIIDTNGKEITAEGTVTVVNPIPTLAATNTWFNPTNDAVKKSTISSITLQNSYTPASTVVDSWPAAVDEDGDGNLNDDITVYVEDDGLGKNTYKMTIAGNGNSSGIFYANEDSSSAFKAFDAMTAFNNPTVMDTSKVVYMGQRYSYYGMFQGCESLTTLDLSGWNTKNVQYLTSTFQGCAGLKTLNVSTWDTRNVKGMVYAFSDCDVLETVDISKWNTSKCTSIAGMFEDSVSIKNLDMATKTVTRADGTTYTAWDVSKVESLNATFRNCESLPYVDVSKWNVGSVEDMLNLFAGCDVLDGINVSDWDTSSVQTMQAVFSGCDSLTSIDVSKWSLASADTIAGMFGCKSLPSVDVATKTVTRADGTTYTAWDTSNVSDMSGLFSGCDIISGMDMTGWNTSNVTDMSSMFSMCYGLVDPSVQNFDTSNVTDMEAMFYQCSSIKTLDLSKWDTSKVTAMGQTNVENGMFYGCSNLITIYATHRFDVTNVTESDHMFTGCTKLVGGADTAYSSSHVEKDYAHVDGGTSNPGYFTNNVFLAYADIKVGQTADPQLTIKSKVFDDYTSIKYEIVSGSEYVSVNETSGVVTGKKNGTATIKVTLGAENGDTITAEGTVNVMGVGITSVDLTYNNVHVGETVDPGLSILPSNADPYQSIKYEITAGGEYASVNENTGVVTGKAVGTATVKVTIVDANGNTVSDTATVTVEAAIQYAEFTVTEDNRTKFGYTGAANEEIVIPATFVENGVHYKVVAIDDWAFDGCSNLKSVQIPDTVTSIGAYAFRDCTNLESTGQSNILPPNLKTLGMYAFFNNTKLSGHVVFPAGLEFPGGSGWPGHHHFANCSNITGATFLCDEVPYQTLCMAGTAATNSKLTTIIIDTSVKSISYLPFGTEIAPVNIYYTGTEAQWNSITYPYPHAIQDITNATKHFNYVIGSGYSLRMPSVTPTDCETDGCTLGYGHEGDCNNVVTPTDCETDGCTLGYGHEGDCNNIVTSSDEPIEE